MVETRTTEGPSLIGQQVVPSSFWEEKSFEELAEEQGVYPITDWEQLRGGWPEDADFEDFLEGIQAARRG